MTMLVRQSSSLATPSAGAAGCLEAGVRAAATDEDKGRIRDGYEAVVRDQAQVLAKVLRSSTPPGRDGILNALWDLHVRHYALPPLKADTVAIGLPAVLTKYVSAVPDPGDLNDVERFARGAAGEPPDVQQQAVLAAQAIRSRSSRQLNS
jgi:hypothetical protein